MKKLRVRFTNIGFILLLAGCASEEKIIDDIDLVTAVGYDYVDGHNVMGTVSIPVFRPDKSISTETFSDVSSLIRENRAKLDSEADKPLFSGKLEVALYSKELAQHGIYQFIDYLNREPSVGSRVLIAVVEGNAKDLIKKKFSTTDTGLYYSSLLEKHIKKGTIPKTNLHQMMYMYFSKGGDPFLPLLKMKNKKVKIDGIALFKDDKYVGKIPFKQTFAFKTLVENFDSGIFPIHNGDKSAVVENVRAKRHYTVDTSRSVPKVNIDISIDGVIREYKGTINNQKMVQVLEKEMEKQITKDYKKIITTMQELNVDPIGLGDIIKSQDRSFNINKYKSYYREIPIKTNVKIKITEYGVTK
ncbi:Ger(x)C family spore germination protein [Neobacillus ginsengisoli]|uniref:Spore germination protein n=1 Tax=Neobacillus ginsengisoli TaxID=904295 RepID=A0ABT9XV79_9BACI|nr:Ger(x)C family spore germination protein [Neobacillus ginsengisoli]MDQ0199473.1 spore germination protein [Neobacillus ginsengisoli]